MAVTPIAGVTHDITLASGSSKYGFMIAPGTFRSERVDDFAPRIATGTDSKTREGYWDSYSQDSAAEGIDQETFLNTNRIAKSDGNIFTDLPQAIQLDSIWSTADASGSSTAPMIIDFGSAKVVSGCGTAVRWSSDGVTWVNWNSQILGGNVVWLHEHNDILFVGCGSTGFYYSLASTNASLTTTNLTLVTTGGAAVQGASAFTTWTKSDQVVYLVKSWKNQIQTSVDNGVNWSSSINVGSSGSVITGLSSAFGYLLIGKEDGLWRYDGTSLVDIVQYPVQKNSTNFRSIVNFDGFIYTQMMGRVLKIALSLGTVSSLVDITPEMLGSASRELYGHGKPLWLFTGPFVLYCAFDKGRQASSLDIPPTPPSVAAGVPELMAYSGSGWHQRYLGTTNGVVMSGAGYSSNFTRLHMNLGTVGLIYKIQVTLRDIPYPSYPTSGTYETSDYTGDLPFMQKAFRALNVEARNLDNAVSRTILVEYSVDKGYNFITMGTISTSGRTNLPFRPTIISHLSDSSTINSNSIRFRFTLNRGSVVDQTPTIVRYSVDFLNRPTATFAHSLNIRLGSTMTIRDGTLETVPVNERLEFLRQIEDSETPIRWVDMIGRNYSVYVTKTSTVKTEKEVEDERLISVVMVDAVTGLWPQTTHGVTMTATVTAQLLDFYYYDFDGFESIPAPDAQIVWQGPYNDFTTLIYDTNLYDITLTRTSARYTV